MEILALAAVAAAGALAAWIRDHRAAGRHNADGECAVCGRRWADVDGGEAWLGASWPRSSCRSALPS